MMAVWQHMKFNCCLFYVKLQTPDLVISAHVGKLLSQKPPRKCFQQQKKKTISAFIISLNTIVLT